MDSPPNKISNPFPGLRPFEETESFLFFGREKHLEDIFIKLNTHRFVALVGSSGSGKSSLVKAGIIPRIASDPDWLQTSFRPGANPLKRLATALQKAFGLDESEILETLNRSSFGLVEIVRKNLPKGKNIFILVDQFEEIFRFDQALDLDGNKIRSLFMDHLLEAYRQRELGIYIMLTLRSDFVGDCDLFYGLPEAMNDGQYLIPRLKNEELERIITGPVMHAGGKIAPRLVQRLVHDISYNPDQLPVLQHVLMRTWDIWEPGAESGRPMDLEHYEQTGGIQHALDNHAEEAFAELTPYDQQIAGRIFSAITTKTTDNRGIRRPLPAKTVSDIAGVSLDVLWRAVAPFRESGTAFLIPTEKMPASEKSIIDISHESLMRNWRRLTDWVEEEYESANFFQRLAESARLYSKGKTGLWRDPDLQIAEGWKEKQKPTPNWAALYDQDLDLSLRFIEESSMEKQRSIAEKKRRVFISRAAVASFLATSGILTLWAFRERNTSEANAELAIKEQKKAQDQEKIALEQSKFAKEQESKAQQNLLIAQTQQKEADRQRRFAEENLKEAAVQRELAEQSSIIANQQRLVAVAERTQALKQKQISDSLRIVSVNSEKQANRLRMLSLADNLAIKSKQLRNSDQEKDIKGILALESYRLMEENNGNLRDPELFEAMQSASLSYAKNKIQVHTDAIKGICYPGNSDNIATCGDDGNVYLTTNGVPKLLTHKTDILEKIASDETGTNIAYTGRTTQENNNIYIYNLNDKSESQIKSPHQDIITGIALTKNLLISVSLDRHFIVREKNNTGKILLNYTADDRISSLSAAKNSDDVYFISENGDILHYSTQTPDKAPVLFGNFHKGKPNCIAVSPDGSVIAAGNYEGNLVIVNTARAEIIANIQMHTSKITGCAINSNGILATASLDRTTKFIDLVKPDARPVLLQDQAEWVEAIAFNAAGNLITSGGKEKALYTNNVQTAEIKKILETAVRRNLTRQEWNQYIGADIPYHETIVR